MTLGEEKKGGAMQTSKPEAKSKSSFTRCAYELR